MTNKFSICIPAFKGKFLKECIESVISQTYKNIEIIIINDHSAEDLQCIVRSFNDPRIQYYYNDVGFGAYNVVDNWNKCLRYATGDYLICMGDDDRLLPNCLENYKRLINTYPNLFVYHTRTEIINEDSEIIDIQEPRPTQESVYSMIYNLWKGRVQFIGDFLFYTKKLKEIGGFYFLPYAWSSDKITTFILAEQKGIANTNIPGFQYRKSSITITNNHSSQRGRMRALLKEKEWYKVFFSQAPPQTNHIDIIYLQCCKLHLASYMEKQMDNMLFWDITDNPLHLFWWYKHYKKFGFPTRTLYKITFTAAKEYIRSIFVKLHQ